MPDAKIPPRHCEEAMPTKQSINIPVRQTPRESGWSAERRAKHAAAIRNWKPWAKSTGPRTKPGKAASSRNALKHGGRAAPARALDKALREQRHFIRAALQCALMKKQNPANELLDLVQKRLASWGADINRRLLKTCEDDIRDIDRHKLDRLWTSGTLSQQYV